MLKKLRQTTSDTHVPYAQFPSANNTILNDSQYKRRMKIAENTNKAMIRQMNNRPVEANNNSNYNKKKHRILSKVISAVVTLKYECLNTAPSLRGSSHVRSTK